MRLLQCCGLGITLAAAVLAAPASADVLDIAPSGALTVYSAPSIFTTDGVRPIATAVPTRHFAIFQSQLRDIDRLLTLAEGRYALRSGLLQSVAWRESHFHNDAVSAKGAVGVMQLMAGTARDLGINRYDLSENILGGAAYLKQMLDRYSGNEALALAAYNAGPGAVDRLGGIPHFTETQHYINAILGTAKPIQGASPFVLFIDR